MTPKRYPPIDPTTERRNRQFGAYIGAAIGDAMGGPVETSHADRIRRLAGKIDGLLPYSRPYTRHDSPRAGYALRFDAGAVTDDTFIRADLTRFLLETELPRTPRRLVDWCLARADFSMWWPPIVEGLRRVERGDVSPENAGDSFFQGGGIGWWTPIGIVHAGDPNAAADESRNLCRIWKAPLERDFLAATQAAVAEGLRPGADVDSMIQAMYSQCGSLAGKLLDRALMTSRKARNVDDLIDRMYRTMLMPEMDRMHEIEPPRQRDAPMPERTSPRETDDAYLSCFFAEQVPVALACFAHCRGEPDAIPTAVMFGRDCDSIATTVGSWVGALYGESGLPAEWSRTVCTVNLPEVDIRGLAESLIRLSEDWGLTA